MTHNGTVDRASWRGQGSGAAVAAAERHARYAGLRRGGMGAWEAAVEVDVEPDQTGRKYERWYQAIERGETPLTRVPAGAA